MSCGCMYILRNAEDVNGLREKLRSTAGTWGYAIDFEPVNNLLLFHSIKLDDHDFIFEVCDDLYTRVGALLLSYDGWMIEDRQALLPLRERLALLQEIARVCLSHTKKVEIFSGDDTPYLPDYVDLVVHCEDVAEAIHQQYQSEECWPWVPCVHVTISEDQK